MGRTWPKLRPVSAQWVLSHSPQTGCIVGVVDWQTEVSGFCRCPSEALHTHQNGKKDCRVSVDGAPTIYCFHASCAPAVAEANRALRRALGSGVWELGWPNGQVLRSGDILKRDGTVRTRADIETGNGSPGVSPHQKAERLVLETVRVMAERDAEDQFRTWLKLWPAHCHVWSGDVFSSGKPEHRTHFRPIADCYQIGSVLANYTCGSSFKPGSFWRCNENLNGQRFLVIESDSLAKDEVGAVFAYLHRRLR